MLTRAGITDDFIVNAKDHQLLPGEHATQQWRRLAHILPARGAFEGAASITEGAASVAVGAATEPATGRSEGPPSRRGAGVVVLPTVGAGGCHLEVSSQQRADLDAWLCRCGLRSPLLAVQVGNKRTMRRGFKRLAPNSKYWPPDRWAALLRHLRARHADHDIVLLGTGPEYRLNAEILALAAVDRAYNAAGELPIPRLVALLERARGLVTVDSGPAHAAAAVGCPQVVLFGKASTSLYRPWGMDGAEAAVLTGRVKGEPSMLGIGTVDVIAAWDGLALRAAAGDQRPAPTGSQ
jgi:heptosyltransferase-2/heptosyltransferase-3